MSQAEFNDLNQEAEQFFAETNTCHWFVRPLTISTEELANPLAFSILLHSDINQFDFLLRNIYRSFNSYCIHVDSKASSDLYESIEKRVQCVTNIFLPERRLNVSWGTFSVLEAERLCQSVLLQRSSQWKYYFNLANTDIPLKTNLEIVRILQLFHNQNDVTSMLYRSQVRQQTKFNEDKRLNKMSNRLHKGEFHVLLTRKAVEFIHQDSRAIDYYQFLNGTEVPDEHFYSTINRWKETPGYYPHDHDLGTGSFMTRYKIWSDRPEALLCRGYFVRTICIFNFNDLWHLATTPHFFANKFLFEQDRRLPY